MTPYTPIQKAAIVSLLIEMINADGHVDLDEMRTLNHINREMGIDEDTFDAGRGMAYTAAVRIAARMTDEQKMLAAKHLISIIDADGHVDVNEITLLDRICNDTGITLIVH